MFCDTIWLLSKGVQTNLPMLVISEALVDHTALLLLFPARPQRYRFGDLNVAQRSQRLPTNANKMQNKNINDFLMVSPEFKLIYICLRVVRQIVVYIVRFKPFFATCLA